MVRKFLLGLIVLSAASCSIPLGESNGARVIFRVVLPDAVHGGGRFVADETSGLRVTVKTPSKPDEVSTHTAALVEGGDRLFTVSIKTSVGAHTLVVESLDDDGSVLTSGQADVVLVSGANSVPIAMTPPLQLSDGDLGSLATGRVAYYTVSGGLEGFLVLNGPGLSFWECAADGSFSGAGQAGSLTLGLASTTDQYVRVAQSGNGNFTAAVLPPSDLGITVDFDLPTSPSIVLAGGTEAVLNASNSPPDVLDLDPQLEDTPGLILVQWTVDGVVNSPAITFYDAAGPIRIDSNYLAAGDHELVIYVTDNTHIYSANVSVKVIRVGPAS